MSQYQTYRLLSIALPCIILSCSDNSNQAGDLPNIYESIEYREFSEKGYATNFLSGDSIRPLVNTQGDTLPSNEWIEFTPRTVEEEDFRFEPVHRDLTWPEPEVAFTAKDSISYDWVSVEPDSFWVHDVFHQGDTFYLVQDFDTLPTGRTIPLKGHELKVNHPEPVPISLPPINAESRYNLKSYRPQQGTEISYVFDIEILRNGEVWLTTLGKLWRLRGNRFQSYGEKEIGTESVHTLYQDDFGNMWIITGEQIICYNGKDFKSYGTDDGFFLPLVRSFDIMGNGDVWVGLANTGFVVYKKKADEVVYLTTNEGIPYHRTTCTSKINDTTLMVGTWGEGIYQINTLTHEMIATSQNHRPKGDFISDIMRDSQGRLWVCTFGKGVIVYNSELTSYITLNQNNGFPSNITLSAIEKDNQNILIGTKNDGLIEISLDKAIFSHYGTKTGHLSDDIRVFEQDRDGNTWIGTFGNGLLCDYGFPFRHIRANEGILDDRPTSILEDGKGNLWLTVADKGLFHVNRSENLMYRFTTEQGINSTIPKSIFEDSKGYLYVSGNGRGFMRIDPDRKSMRITNKYNGLNNNYTHGMFEDDKEQIWIGTATGFTVHNPELNTSLLYGHNDGVWTRKVTNIIKDDRGAIWMSTHAAGALQYYDGKFKYLTEKEGLLSNHLNQILQDKNGRMWYATDAGLCVLDDQKFYYLLEENGLSNNNIKSLVEDGKGRVWVGTSYGLNCVQALENESGALEFKIRAFRSDDGLVGLDFKDNGAIYDSEGYLWWCTENGLTRLSEDDFEFGHVSTKPVMRDLLVNGSYIDYSQEISDNGISYTSIPPFSNVPEQLELEHYNNHLTFELGLANWNSPGNTYFSYQLQGIDEGWSKPTKNWTADYRNIPYGKHVFQYACWSPDQGWSEIKHYKFTVNPPWYHTLWASVMYVLFSVFLVWLFMKYRTKQLLKRQKELEDEVDRATIEIRTQHEEIMDSISYARRIQAAILPPQKLVKEYLKDSFILYKPKDIVAGDFYWMETDGGTILFAAADCTGHGVPGAMVSVICNGGLNRSVNEFGLKDPGKILDKTRELVIAEFEKSEDEVKDGMDIALCALEGNKLKYAGAHNALWIIRNGSEEVEQIKADKQPIGKYAEESPFTTHTVELNPGDTIYLYSDGFADQFGGEKGKKLKAANFKKLLISMQNESMDDQKEMLDEAFEKWKGNLEQVDDVCVIGVRV